MLMDPKFMKMYVSNKNKIQTHGKNKGIEICWYFASEIWEISLNKLGIAGFPSARQKHRADLEAVWAADWTQHSLKVLQLCLIK